MTNQTKKEVIKLNNVHSKTLSELKTTSAKIRYLHYLDYSQGDISRKVSEVNKKWCRPQHVSNVLGQNVTTPTETFPKNK